MVIEHDMEFVEDIAHKVTVLHQGQDPVGRDDGDRCKNDPKVIEVYLGHCMIGEDRSSRCWQSRICTSPTARARCCTA